MRPRSPSTRADRARSSSFNPWQSFADLALGLMAVFALVLVMLLWTQGEKNDTLAAEKTDLEAHARQLERDKAQLEQVALSLDLSKRDLEHQRSAFALELLELFAHTRAVVEAQDGAEAWIRDLFRDGRCPLVMAEDGTLRRADRSTAAELYRPGEARMNADGEQALSQCRDTFVRLASCLSPDAASPEPQSAAAKARARTCHGVPDPSKADPRTRAQLDQLRKGLEALVLQGNTDRTSVISASLGVEPIRSQGERMKLNPLTESFVQNAHLGTERARQALGHLLRGLQDHDADANDALQVMMARVRVESPSFGRYQAGPQAWRMGQCAPGADSCAEARNLSLSVRWKKQELRAPYEAILSQVCDMLAHPDSALGQGVVGLLQSPELVRHMRVPSDQWAALVASGEVKVSDVQTLLGCPAAGAGVTP
jgi:hypothetical protein